MNVNFKPSGKSLSLVGNSFIAIGDGINGEYENALKRALIEAVAWRLGKAMTRNIENYTVEQLIDYIINKEADAVKKEVIKP